MFIKGWWYGIKLNDYESLLNFSKGLNFGSHQVILKEKTSENLSSSQFEVIYIYLLLKV